MPLQGGRQNRMDKAGRPNRMNKAPLNATFLLTDKIVRLDGNTPAPLYNDTFPAIPYHFLTISLKDG